jgi:hypothetical protein
MPLTKIEYQAGVNADDTPLSAEGGWTDADKVRFVRDRPETIGGWDPVLADTVDGVTRGGHAWVDIEGRKYAAFGTSEGLFVYASGQIYDITPRHSQGVLSNPFTTSNGSPTVTVTHADHGMITGQIVEFLIIQTSPVGGLNLHGGWIITVTGPDSYTITHTNNASSTAVNSGGSVDWYAILPDGLVDAQGEPGGYGSGDYSEGGYGGSVLASDTLPRVWHLDNWGENLLAVPRGGGLYEWQPSLEYPELMTNGDFGSGSGWTAGTGWSIGAGVATATAGTASSLYRTLALEPGKTYEISVTITRTAGSLDVGWGGVLLPEFPTVSHSGTFARVFKATAPASSALLVFAKDATFAGTIDNISVKLVSRAYRINEAPKRNDAMFVDPSRIVVLIGTSLYNVSESDGHDPYNQMAIRTSDIENNRQWVPASDNMASDYLLAVGGRAISGLATRQQNLVWTDTAIYGMQFTGDPAEPFRYSLLGTGCGLGGPLAKAEHNGAAFWMSKDNFFAFGGSTPSTIPSTVRRYVFENMDALQIDKTVAGINPAFNEVWFFYPDARDGNECSRYVACKRDSPIWTVGTFDRTTWIKPGVFDYPIAVSSEGAIYYHEKGKTAGGSPLESYLTGSYSDLEDGENLATLLGIIPDFEGQEGAVSFDIYLKQFPNATEVHKGTYAAAPNTTKIDLRAKARLMKVKLSATSSPSFWRLGGLRANMQRSGERR